MGAFTAKFRIWNPDRAEGLEAIVDTGAAFSWISRAPLERLGVSPSRRMPFRAIERARITVMLALATANV
jgi:hypothetical protein